jgi:hypothetical protein
VNDREKNLKVLTEHVRWLAEKQHAASGRITVANQAVNGAADTVLNTHGVACIATHLAVIAAQSAREAAGGKIYEIATGLEGRLHTAAALYENTDYQNGLDISACRV